MKRLVFIALSVILMSTFISMDCSASPKTLKIGFLAALTGFLSTKDIPDVNMAKAAAEVLNKKGGITVKGQQYMIEFIFEDYKTNMDGITSATNRLVYDHGVKFIIGPTAFFSSGAGPITDPAKVIRVITFACNTPGELDATTPYCFLGSNGSIGKFMGSLKYLKKAYPDVKKVAIVMPDDGTIKFLLPLYQTALAAEGLTLVDKPILYPNQMQDFSPIVVKVNALEEADAICHTNGVSQQIGAIVKGVRESGNFKPYAGMMCATMNDIVAVAGLEASQDVFMASTSADEQDLPPLGKEVIQRYIAKHGKETSLILYAANCLYMLKQAIEGAQSFDTDVVKTYWESMDTIDTLEGPGIMCGDKTYGIRHHAVAHPQPIQILDKHNNAVSGGLMDIGTIP